MLLSLVAPLLSLVAPLDKSLPAKVTPKLESSGASKVARAPLMQLLVKVASVGAPLVASVEPITSVTSE